MAGSSSGGAPCSRSICSKQNSQGESKKGLGCKCAKPNANIYQTRTKPNRNQLCIPLNTTQTKCTQRPNPVRTSSKQGSRPARAVARSFRAGRLAPCSRTGSLLVQRPARSLCAGRLAPYARAGSLLVRGQARSLYAGRLAPCARAGSLLVRGPARSLCEGRRAPGPCAWAGSQALSPTTRPVRPFKSRLCALDLAHSPCLWMANLPPFQLLREDRGCFQHPSYRGCRDQSSPSHLPRPQSPDMDAD